jgi:hypothetical protein
MLAMAFLAVHILTSVLDSFAPIALIDAVLPFIGSYRPLWLGLGAVSFDLLLAVFVTSLVRQRVGYRAWRATHWLAYAAWPIALVHTLGTGSDVKSGWLLALSAACLLVVLAAVAARALNGWPAQRRVRAGVLAAVAAAPVALLVWLPGGPLERGWARRAGTPLALLASTGSSAPSTGTVSHTSASPSAVLEGRFDTNLAGSIAQEAGPTPGLQIVNITTAFSRPTSGQLRIALEGQALNEGGVAMRASRVTLGSSASPALYRGQIVGLSGEHIVAAVRRSDGHALSLDIRLHTTPGATAVSGTLAASPAQGGGTE